MRNVAVIVVNTILLFVLQVFKTIKSYYTINTSHY